MNTPIFIAHRGYASAYPENTMIAIEAAQQAGAGYIEVDIQLTKDGVPVLFHDRNLQRLCQHKGAIHDYSLSELENFYVTDKEKFSDMYSTNRITTLETLIGFLKKQPQLNAFIELKRLMIDTFGEEQVMNTVLPMFEGIQEKITFISYNQAILKKIHLETTFTTGIVVDDWIDFNKDAGWKSEWVFCSVEGLPDDNTELEVDSNIAVFEVGNIGLAKHLLARGITYLETFRIKEMLEAFSVNS